MATVNFTLEAFGKLSANTVFDSLSHAVRPFGLSGIWSDVTILMTPSFIDRLKSFELARRHVFREGRHGTNP